MSVDLVGGSLVLGLLDSGGWQTGSVGGEGRSAEIKVKMFSNWKVRSMTKKSNAWRIYIHTYIHKYT